MDGMGNKKIRGSRAVILFTKVPQPGRVKTRMMPYLSGEECAELMTCFLKDIRNRLALIRADIIVCYDAGGGSRTQGERGQAGCAGPGPLRSIFGKKASYIPQRGEDLGRRMAYAFRDAFDLGYTSCILMGSDIPEVRTADIQDAFGKLEQRDVVVGPSADGGYWLIGMHKLHYCLFEDREYSHGSVFDELVSTADREGLTYDLTVMRQDIDTPEDIRNYISCMREEFVLRTSCTGRYLAGRMSISLIMPVYNEITTIDSMIRQLDRLRDKMEIIIVDGGSTDGTCERIPDRFTLLHSGKGRARQMNAGAAASHGDILFFLHCDSELPDDPAGEIRRVMARCEAGCFGIGFHSRHFFMMTNRVISNLRAGIHHVMFGDQGIFMTRELFEQTGGFPEIPVMEDYQMSLTLRDMDIRTGLARHRIYTSDRRYPKKTGPMLELMAKMYMLRRDYKAGRPPEEIAEEYKDIR